MEQAEDFKRHTQFYWYSFVLYLPIRQHLSNMQILYLHIGLLATIIITSTTAFTVDSTNRLSNSQRIPQCSKLTELNLYPGGWGIGTPIDFQDEEFSNNSASSRSKKRRRRKDASTSSGGPDATDIAYNEAIAEKARFNMQDSQQFAQRVQSEKMSLQQQKKNDLLKIAQMAGLGDRMKPKVNENEEVTMGKFEDDLFDDDESLDVRVY